MRSTFLLAGLSACLSPVHGDAALLSDAEGYNGGKYGTNPNQTYHSSKIVSPLIQINKWEKTKVDDTPYIFLGLSGDSLEGDRGHSGPVILRTDDLSLVYAEPRWPNAADVKVGTANGVDYLTFYEGAQNPLWEGHCLLYDSSYRVAYNISVPSGHGSMDMHECQVTANGTVVVTTYETISFDLTSAGGPEDGNLVDGVAQEIDIETGEVLWTWRASDHVDLRDSYANYHDGGPVGWDFFHMNSIDKSAEGNYLISSRHFHSLYYIDGQTGGKLWTLGGKKNNFTDISDSNALNFAWQHHARVRDESITQLTLFDNHELGTSIGCSDNCSRGKHLEIDHENMKARLLHDYLHPESLNTGYMGSYQATPKGNVLAGWGPNPSITEYLPGGECVFDMQFDTWDAGKAGARGSYRAFKMEWKGFPDWDPSIVAVKKRDGLKAYVSWNGATEVAEWQLLQGVSPDTTTDAVLSISRAGFETEIALQDGHLRYIRAAAIDAHGQILGYSGTLDLKTDVAVEDLDDV
ncbi:Arylsulfotransferase-domain-containing protein [Xylariaceae sp. FL0016]|nr:Arylsulfotransferase-domain-containing protein [Xylariaceae sp. FL0016]